MTAKQFNGKNFPIYSKCINNYQALRTQINNRISICPFCILCDGEKRTEMGYLLAKDLDGFNLLW